MSQLNQLPMFFLGANSPEGFISKFSSSYFADSGWRTYIIKGGPGTGKSTMGRIWAGLLKEHNQLSHGHFVLATRSSFVGTRWGLEEENLIKILDIAERYMAKHNI